MTELQLFNRFRILFHVIATAIFIAAMDVSKSALPVEAQHKQHVEIDKLIQ